MHSLSTHAWFWFGLIGICVNRRPQRSLGFGKLPAALSGVEPGQARGRLHDGAFRDPALCK